MTLVVLSFRTRSRIVAKASSSKARTEFWRVGVAYCSIKKYYKHLE